MFNNKNNHEFNLGMGIVTQQLKTALAIPRSHIRVLGIKSYLYFQSCFLLMLGFLSAPGRLSWISYFLALAWLRLDCWGYLRDKPVCKYRSYLFLLSPLSHCLPNLYLFIYVSPILLSHLYCPFLSTVMSTFLFSFCLLNMFLYFLFSLWFPKCVS